MSSFSTFLHQNKTSVTIIGTFHGAHRSLEYYAVEKLKQLNLQTKPDVLAIQVRAEDYTKADFSNNPWDIYLRLVSFNNSQVPSFVIYLNQIHIV